MQFWNSFAAKHPAAAKWVREGGLFVIVSNLITVFKYLLPGVSGGFAVILSALAASVAGALLFPLGEEENA